MREQRGKKTALLGARITLQVASVEQILDKFSRLLGNTHFRAIIMIQLVNGIWKSHATPSSANRVKSLQSIKTKAKYLREIFLASKQSSFSKSFEGEPGK